MDSEEDETDTSDLFREPEGYYRPQQPASDVCFSLPSGLSFKLHLVAQNPLWGHLLWNAGKLVTEYLETNASRLVVNKTVLELGAGAGLPSIACIKFGARKVVVTDYPDPSLIENIRKNIDVNCPGEAGISIVAEGFLWGGRIDSLQRHLSESDTGFDLLILADILFNHSEHEKLVKSVCAALKRTADARALVFFTPYRPWLFERDMDFFRLAAGSGLIVDKVHESQVEHVMFEHDRGDEALRRTVFGYECRWPQ